MRVTRESLLRIAKETAQERAYNDPDIIAVYLTGSLLNVEPMLGGTADIDLIIVQKSETLKPREFTRLTPDFHLDISRRAKSEFKSPRELRGDPWLGYELYDPILLYEREKFFDFAQASLRAGFEFEQPAMILQRCRALLSHGRQIWFDLQDVSDPTPRLLRKYFKALFHALNAVAELNGPPVYDRRLLLEFPARAEAANKAQLTAKAFELVGAGNVSADVLGGWLTDWKSAFELASERSERGRAAHIHPARLNYYEKAIRATLEGTTPLAALWTLFTTWTTCADVLQGEPFQIWQNAARALGFSAEDFSQRVEGLDAFLDEVEVALDELASANGLEIGSGLL